MGECRSTVLASGPCAEVTRCSCGHVHLSLGPLTIRLEDSVLRAVSITLDEAVTRMASPTPRTGELSPWKQ